MRWHQSVGLATWWSGTTCPPIRAMARRRAGARLLFLSAYSPDHTPIERLWSKVKAYLRRVAARSQESLHTALGEALRHVTPSDIIGWFQHAGLCATHG